MEDSVLAARVIAFGPMTTTTAVMPTRDVTIGDTFVRISGQGFPLVFVHGFTTTSEFWRKQAEEFSKA
jgi:pimeloyl-ACP methyl ester carboxylesterase